MKSIAEIDLDSVDTPAAGTLTEDGTAVRRIPSASRVCAEDISTVDILLRHMSIQDMVCIPGGNLVKVPIGLGLRW